MSIISLASINLHIVLPFSNVNTQEYFSLFLTACIKSSVILTDIFALVTAFKSVLISINSSISGCDTSIEIINAPRLPFWPIVSATCEKVGIKDTAPVVVLAALFTGAFLGLNLLISIPTPPP